MSTHRYTLPRTGDDPDADSALLWAAGALGVWQRPDALVAWFHAPTDAVPAGGRWDREPDRDWQAEWKATVGPVTAGRITIVPTWRAAEHRPRPDELTLVLDPGRAFGSGHHATTTQCLELLQHIPLAGRRVLDVGCGSGVLSLAAALLGAATVEAVDIDDEAVEVTRENAARTATDVDAHVGSVGAARAPAHVVLANLVTDTIVALAGGLFDATIVGGDLIASGIADERRERALEALRDAGFEVAQVQVRAGWVALRARRPGAAAQVDPSGGGGPP